MTMTTDADPVDLLVLGAGPAGCAAAIQARRSGQRVLILEPAGRGRPAPGKTLHPGIEPIFERLGVRDAVIAENFHRHRGVWTEWDGSRTFTPFGADQHGPWAGFQADRSRLKSLLLEAALALGAELNGSDVPERSIIDTRGVAGVVAGGKEFHARWTVDATGRRAWLARKLRLVNSRCSPRMLAKFWWTDAACDDLDGQPSIRAEARGWSWTAPLGASRTAQVSLTVHDPGESPAHGAGTDVSWRIHRNCAAPGYLLLGEAAAVLDPLSSHGVLRALMSGMLGGHLICANNQGRLSDVDLAERYAGWLTQQFDFDVTALTELYRRHPTKDLANMFC
jgi:flavin-dependent dehydrogenase